MKNKIIIFIACILVGASAVFGVYRLVKENDKKKEPEAKEPVVNTNKSGNYNVDLIKAVHATQHGNYLVSPYSIEIALQMLGDGAKGESKAQIENLIGDRDIPTFTAEKRISVANAAFIREQYKTYVNDSYYKNLKGYNADIVYDAYITPTKINDWVNEHTYGMIPQILEQIDPAFILGIANAVAIDVEWQQSFKCELTSGQQFTQINGAIMSTQMMHQEYVPTAVKYFETSYASGIVIPYKAYTKDGKISYDEKDEATQLEFVGILPNTDVDDYISKLSKEELDIDDNIVKVEEDFVALSLPRFSYSFDFKEFKETLVKLGVKDVFSPDNADLTGIISRENMKKMDTDNIYVGEAVHKTYIDLNENGTKAAAVTYFGVYENTAIGEEPEHTYKVIEFDKPFAYMIRDSKTKEILFFGVVKDPKLWEGPTCENEE